MSVNEWVAVSVFAVALVIFGFLLYRLIACPTNQLKWEDLIATHGNLNAFKLGYWVGVGVGGWIVFREATVLGRVDPTVFGEYLAFLGGVQVLQAAQRGNIPDAPKRGIDDPDRK